MAVNYIVCAAGDGSRFKSLLPDTIKPKIKLNNRSLLSISLQSLPIYFDDIVILVTRKEHDLKSTMLQEIKSQYPFTDIRWIELSNQTSGQLQTAYLAKEVVDMRYPIAIFNSDTYFESKDLMQLMKRNEIEGIIPCVFEEKGDGWSFCKVDDHDKVIEVAEKRRISNWCSVGFYFFRDSKTFFEFALEELKNENVNEHYVAPLYKRYIDADKNVILSKVDLFKPMGTPDQLKEYWGVDFRNVILENSKKVIVIDIDNTITIENSNHKYSEKKPNEFVIAKMREYKEKGYEIILHTARRMKTHSSNESKVVADIGPVTFDWLNKHNVPFDGIKFGKPYAENGFYVDDRAVRVDEFIKYDDEELLEILNLQFKK